MTVQQFVLFGDSLTAGGADGASMVSQGGRGCWAELDAERLANISSIGPLVSAGFRGIWNGVFPYGSTEWTQAGSWTLTASTDAYDKSPHGLAWSASGSTNIATYTVSSKWRPLVGFAIYWIDYAAGGNWSYRINGGAWTAMGQTLLNDNHLCKFYVATAVLPGQTIEIRAANAAGTATGCLPIGIEPFFLAPSTADGLIVHNLGAGSKSLHGAVLASSGDRLAWFDTVRLGTGSPISNTPTAVISMFINDVTIANTTTYGTDLTTLNARISPLCPLGLMNPWGMIAATYNETQQAAYRAQLKTSAAGFSTPAKVLDLYDLLNSFGYVSASTIVAAGSSGTQTASLTGTQQLTVTSTAGFPKGGEFALTGTNGNDAKITYKTVDDSTHFGGCMLFTGADVQMIFGDTIALTQNAALTTAGFLFDGVHETQLGHSWIAERVYWFIRTQIIGITIGPEPTIYPIKGTKAAVAYTGTKATASYASELPIGVG